MEKRKHPTFKVPGYGAKGRSRLKDRWRKQRGKDNKMKIKRSGYGFMPNIGYRQPNSIRAMRQDGTYEVLVHNERELIDAATRKNVSIRFANALSAKKKAELQRIADEQRIEVVNRVKK